MKRIIISVAAALLLLAILLPSAVFAAGTPSGSSSGSFVIGHQAPSINSVKLFDSTGTTEITSSMTPQTQYMFKVDVTHTNSLAYLTQLRIIVFYYNGTPIWPNPAVLLSANAASGQKDVVVSNVSGFIVGHNVLIKTATVSEFRVIGSIAGNILTMTANLTNSYTTADRATISDLMDSPVIADSQICARFNWDKSTNLWTSNYPPTSGDSGTSTWSSGLFTKPTVFTGNNFVFTGQFTPGKVATAGTWYVRARITDTLNYDARGNTSGITMNPYDEIVLSTGSMDWGSVTPGLGFADSPNPLPVTVKYIANGNYSKYISSSNWTGSAYTATLNYSGTPSALDEFSLKAVIGSNTGYVRAVDGTYAYGTLLDNTGTRTYEAGDIPTPSTMSLSVYGSFDTDTYQGTMIYYIITR